VINYEYPKHRNKIALLAGLGLFGALCAIYLASPVRTSFDSRWSIATAMSFIRGEAGDLSAYMPPSPGYAGGSYAIAQVGTHTYSIYPIGPPLLAVPAVVVASWWDPAFANYISEQVPDRLEKAIASFYGAIACAVFFWMIFVRFNDIRIAVATTIVFGLGTSMWSTCTRALWQHGPLILWLVIAILLLLAARRRATMAQYVSIPLALSFITRPTAAIPILLMSAYVLVCYRTWFVRFMIWAACIAAAWMTHNLLTWGAPLPPYYLLLATGVADSTFQDALLGNLISPARGLFIFSPVLIFAISGFVLAMRAREDRALHLTFGLIIVLHWLAVSHFKAWWGGHSFGPRIMSDVLPFLCYFLAFSLQWCLSTISWPRVTALVLMTGLAAASIFIHAQGAIRWAPYGWNVSPANVDQQPARLWDWHDLQFARR
jgi:hypothetical protein